MANVLMGEYLHNMDTKGRVSFPTKLREILGETFYVTKTIDKHCLTVYPQEEWEKLSNKVAQLPQAKSANIRRVLFSGAGELNPDKQGRVLIPQHLREYAGLDKDVMVIGACNVAEIWDKAAWDDFNGSFDTADLMEVMGEYNV